MNHPAPSKAADASSFVSVTQFGKDHWSTFAYAETCCVDSSLGDGLGRLDLRRMRCNPDTHPLLSANGTSWHPEHGTRLFGYFDAKKEHQDVQALGLLLDTHDDWDCLDDLEEAGFLDVVNLTHGVVKLTPEGSVVAARLRVHKANGGQFAQFVNAA